MKKEYIKPSSIQITIEAGELCQNSNFSTNGTAGGANTSREAKGLDDFLDWD